LGHDTCCHTGRGPLDCAFRATRGHLPGSPDDYREWPVWDTKAHQRYWQGHLKRALDQGMKLMVALAVENEFLCTTADLYTSPGAGGRTPRRCVHGDSLESVTNQIVALEHLAAQYPFLAIARSPAEARAIISQGKLAVVIGVEADYAWGTEKSESELIARLDAYYAKGARTVLLAHQFNTRLAGAAQYFDTLWVQQSMANCFERDVQCVGSWSGPGAGRVPFAVLKWAQPRSREAGYAATYYEMSLPTLASRVRHPDKWDGFAAGCSGVYYDVERGVRVRKNGLGLTPEGARIVTEMMKRGMLLDVAHLSERAIDGIVALTAPAGYPINSSHTLARAVLPLKGARIAGEDEMANAGWEYALGDRTLERIAASGGVAALFAGADPTVEYPESTVANNCVRSTRSLAQTMAYVVDKHVKVAWAGDWMGQGRGVAPRRGYTTRRGEWCGGVDADQRAQDPVADRPLASYADLDERDAAYFGTRGLGHWGLVGALHRDLELLFEKRPEVVAAFRDDGAENFVQAWEGSEAARDRLLAAARPQEGN
jgi:microsomal dipeptidase-like Zn-dependent dipeptidase